MSLTPRQREVLTVLDRKWRSGPELNERLPAFGATPTALHGLHETLASLVRRGLAIKTKLSGGIVHYQITDSGAVEQQGNRRG